jgi:uncharacterized membrane protein
MKPFIRYIKLTMVGGFIFLIPLIVLVFIFNKAFQLSLIFSEPISKYIPIHNVFGLAMNTIISVLIIAVICFLAGLLSHYTILRRTIQRSEEKFLWKVPGYAFIKGFTESISGEDSVNALKPVLVSLDDASLIAFEVEKSEDGKSVLYVPGAPNPWTGSIMIVEQERIKYLPVTMANAMRTFSSLGSGTKVLMKNYKSSAG